MTTTPQALALADALEKDKWHVLAVTLQEAADLLRTQHAEIERLNAAIKWEQNRAERIGTHGPGCEKWGPAHYECALRAIERKDALLKQATRYVGICVNRDGDAADVLYDAITKELQ